MTLTWLVSSSTCEGCFCSALAARLVMRSAPARGSGRMRRSAMARPMMRSTGLARGLRVWQQSSVSHKVCVLMHARPRLRPWGCDTRRLGRIAPCRSPLTTQEVLEPFWSRRPSCAQTNSTASIDLQHFRHRISRQCVYPALTDTVTSHTFSRICLVSRERTEIASLVTTQRVRGTICPRPGLRKRRPHLPTRPLLIASSRGWRPLGTQPAVKHFQ